MASQDVGRTSGTELVRKAPLRGALVVGGDSESTLVERLVRVQTEARAGCVPEPAAPAEADLRARERLAIDYGTPAELIENLEKALKAMALGQPAVWKLLRAQGIFRGHGPACKVAFLYTGQGSQYLNMLRVLHRAEPILADTFAEADRTMKPFLGGRSLTEFMFVEGADPEVTARAEEDLAQIAITQPAVIASDIALTRLLAAYDIQPDMVMGHSVGEYGALVASGSLSFEDALEVVSARSREAEGLSLETGTMAAIFAPLDEIERELKKISGYVVIANVNSYHQAVIGGNTEAVKQVVEAFIKAGYDAVPLPVSNAFHTAIVSPYCEPLRRLLRRVQLKRPNLPVISNVNGEFYPTGPDAISEMLENLTEQVASPVQFVKGLLTLYDAGARVFVETGPKKALQGFAEDVLGGRGDVVSIFTNHPKFGDLVAFNQALCGLYAAGLGNAGLGNNVMTAA